MLLRTSNPLASVYGLKAASLASSSVLQRIRDGRCSKRWCCALKFSTRSKLLSDEGQVQAPGVFRRLAEKPDTCTGDELHYINAADGKWKLAMWRYRPLCSAPVRNHPLLLLSGVATNAIGFDLDPSVSFARYMSEQGFDTWILEMRGAGLSIQKEADSDSVPAAFSQQVENLDKLEDEIGRLEKIADAADVSDASYSQNDKDTCKDRNGSSHALTSSEVSPSSTEESAASSADAASTASSTDAASSTQVSTDATTQESSWEITKTASQLSTVLSELSERLKAVVNEGQSRVLSVRLAEQLSAILEDSQLSHRYQEIKERLLRLLEERRSSAFSLQLNELSSKLTRMLQEAQVSVSNVKALQGRLNSTIDDFRKFLELIVNYDWDFDNYVDEDVPAAISYILDYCKPKDGKLLGVGHSMGGIVLYALLATKGQEAGFAAVVTVASSLDYSASNSTLHMLLPLADPAQALNVPVVPLGAIMQAAYPLVARPPYALAWIGYNVSCKGMMDPELYKKLVLNNFCTVPAKLILQLKTAFEPGGLRNRDGKITYRDLLSTCKVPVLAIAGDRDLICPPSAVTETVDALPAEIRKCVIFGENDKHYGHYDLLVSRTAKTEVFPVILEFIAERDQIAEGEH